MTAYDDPAPHSERRHLAPHRGAAVLVLGILGLVICFICGIIAWAMGSGDLRAMREGRMDPSGESLTNAGRICGMIATILNCIVIVILIIAAASGAGFTKEWFDSTR
jgi:hypothetical protein